MPATDKLEIEVTGFEAAEEEAMSQLDCSTATLDQIWYDSLGD